MWKRRSCPPVGAAVRARARWPITGAANAPLQAMAAAKGVELRRSSGRNIA